MTDAWERGVLLIAARTALRCERLLLRLVLERARDGDVLAHNDECIRLKGYSKEDG